MVSSSSRSTSGVRRIWSSCTLSDEMEPALPGENGQDVEGRLTIWRSVPHPLDAGYLQQEAEAGVPA